MGPRTGLDLVEKGKFLLLPGIETRFIGHPVHCLANILTEVAFASLGKAIEINIHPSARACITTEPLHEFAWVTLR